MLLLIMKKIVRIFAVEVAGLYITSQIAQGLAFEYELEGLVITGIALAIAMYLVKPIVNVLLLPLNMITLGLFKFLSHAVTIYIVDIALSQFQVQGFHFPGLVSRYLDLPSITLAEGPLAYVAFSVLLSVITALLG